MPTLEDVGFIYGSNLSRVDIDVAQVDNTFDAVMTSQLLTPSGFTQLISDALQDAIFAKKKRREVFYQFQAHNEVFEKRPLTQAEPRENFCS